MPKADLMMDEPAESEAVSSTGRDNESSSWRVCVDGCEKLKCILCGRHATDETVLNSCLLRAKYGKYYPWRRYKMLKAEQARRPEGKICAISANVFTALGLDHEYETHQEYAVHINKPENAAEGRRFALASAQWIKMYNAQEEGGTDLRLKNPKECGNV